jgi:hypothetical protein
MGDDQLRPYKVVDKEQLAEIESEPFEISTLADPCDSLRISKVFCDAAGDQIGFIVAAEGNKKVR